MGTILNRVLAALVAYAITSRFLRTEKIPVGATFAPRNADVPIGPPVSFSILKTDSGNFFEV